MSVFSLDTTGDLTRDRAGFVRTSGLDAIAQDVRVYLRLRQGEIPSRIDLGIRWQLLLRAGVATGALEQEVGEHGVLSRPGVVAQETTVDLDGEARSAIVTVRATVSLDDQRRRQALALTILVTI